MPRPEQQLGTPIPDCHHDFIPIPQRLQRRLAYPRQAEIPNLDAPAGIHEDIRGLEVPMDDPVGVEVGCADEELVEEGFEGWVGDVYAECLVVVVDYLLRAGRAGAGGRDGC